MGCKELFVPIYYLNFAKINNYKKKLLLLSIIFINLPEKYFYYPVLINKIPKMKGLLLFEI